MTEASIEPKTYLITGGAGFIASHLTETLLAGGHTVLAIDNLSTGSYSNITPFVGSSNYHFARASVMDEIVMDRLASQAEVIIHLAAAVGVTLIVEHPVHTIETNIKGTEVVLNLARRYNSRVLIASTSEVYGKGNRIPFSEEDDVVLGATSKSRWGYAASKMIDEFLGFAYQREFDLDTVLFRLFNTVGPRQSHRYGMVVPRFVRQALRDEPLTVYGDGEQSRCFCDVRDVVRAIVGLSDSPAASGKVFNIGSTSEITILGLAEMIKSLAGSKSSIVRVPYSEAYAPGFEDMRRRVPDIGRINALIGWEPTRSLEQIVQSIIDYERNAATKS